MHNLSFFSLFCSFSITFTQTFGFLHSIPPPQRFYCKFSTSCPFVITFKGAHFCYCFLCTFYICHSFFVLFIFNSLIYRKFKSPINKMGSVVTKPMEWIGDVLCKAGESVFNAIFGDKMSSRALPSSQDVLFPPISQVLTNNGCPQVIDNLKNCLKYKNMKAIEHTGNLLSDRGLDNITTAFKKAVEENMICQRCEKEIKFIDELCYCPEDSDEKCHHGTSCCDNRKIKALTSGR